MLYSYNILLKCSNQIKKKILMFSLLTTYMNVEEVEYERYLVQR